jgi:hypothetical protein
MFNFRVISKKAAALYMCFYVLLGICGETPAVEFRNGEFPAM